MKKIIITTLIITLIFSCQKKTKNPVKETKVEPTVQIGDNYATKPDLIGKQAFKVVKLFPDYLMYQDRFEIKNGELKKYFCSIDELREFGRNEFEFGSRNYNIFSSLNKNEYYGTMENDLKDIYREYRYKQKIYFFNVEFIDFSYEGKLKNGAKMILGLLTVKSDEHIVKIRTSSILINGKYKLTGLQAY